ncbi:ABC transporter ATP-binding protein/permease [Lederbergia sp. NSJ-179]|uniref:ABC transporter ATP-binding protein n=1 Tax=Lederbergia sp. NSJ-179 TaxID=2931402 RepID=UPI001FD5B8DE|nr:ABC transporter ATP-binding protein [Lederbergia sp. NSJ-179]MCJ7841983.1 ABC transporter ATP-binding protein/permease [Lederbergia sp. NSJ-179]
MGSLRWLLRYMRLIKFGFFLLFIIVALETICHLSIFGIQKFIIDGVFLKGKYDELPYILMYFGILILVYTTMFTLGPYLMFRLQAKLNLHITGDLMQYMYKIPILEFQKERIAKFTHYFTDDARKISEMISREIPRGFQQICSVIILVAVISYTSPIISLFIVIFSSVYIFLGQYFSSKLKQARMDVQERKSDLMIRIEEGIASTREVVAFHRTEWEKKLYNHLFQKYFDRVMLEGKMINKQMFVSEPLKWGINLFVLAYGGYLVMVGDMSLGVFVVIYQFTSQLMNAFHSLFSFCMNISGEIAYIDRIKHVLEGDRITSGNLPMDKSINSITFETVSFSYYGEQKDVLIDLSFQIPMKKKIAIVGLSGSGKSTIAQLLMRFFDPEDGEIRVNSHPLKDINRDQWMKKIGIVFQEPYIFSGTIRDNVTLGAKGSTDSDLIQACKLAKAHEFIIQLPQGYDTSISERGITLSGGQRQRIALARAIYKNPDILILDEATSALDLETERMVQKNLDEYRKEKTTLVIAHRISTVQDADLIMVIDQGRLAEEGTHNELMSKNSLYKKICLTRIGSEESA